MAELTEEEGKKLIEAFNKLKLKPKADTPQDLELWLKAFSGVKAEPGVPTDGATGGTSGGTSGGSSKKLLLLLNSHAYHASLEIKSKERLHMLSGFMR